MGRTKIYWHHAWLGLQNKTSPPIYVKLCHKSSQKIQAQVTKNQHQPYPSALIIYGAKKKYTTPLSTAPFLDKRARNSFNKPVENSYSLAEQWIVLCYAQSLQLPHSQRPQRKIQWNRPNRFLITLQHKKRLYSHSMRVSWNWRHTATPATWANRKRAAGQEAISTYQAIPPYHKTTEQSST